VSGGIFVALGANLDNPVAQLRAAQAALAAHPGIQLLRASRIYRSAPWGDPHQPDYANAAVEIDTELEPSALMQVLLGIERGAGRVRDARRNAPRTLDLDLLSYRDTVVAAPDLTLPHPRLRGRAFVLVPLAEIAPDANLPGLGRVRDLLQRLDASGVTPWLAAGS
jgi:2-amino-4-hydroxy-6-hydroxymethyldihydropteridine diphosphokinase